MRWRDGAADILLTSRLLRCERVEGSKKLAEDSASLKLRPEEQRSQEFMLLGIESGHGAASSMWKFTVATVFLILTARSNAFGSR